MFVNRIVSLSAALLVTSMQWAVFFHPHLYLDAERLAEAAMVAQSAHPAALSLRGAGERDSVRKEAVNS